MPRGVHGDAELRALDHGGEIGRLDLEMLDVALLDLEQDRARLLDDGGRRALPSSPAGRPTTEFGEIKIVSSPRTSSTRPLRPVRMVSPGFSTSFLVSDAGCAPVAASPDLTRELADRPDAIVRGGCASKPYPGSARPRRRTRDSNSADASRSSVPHCSQS